MEKLNQIFSEIDIDLSIIRPSDIITRQFNELKNFLLKKKISPIHYFNQIKRNDKFEGLMSETMFFDENGIYDIVIGHENIDFNIVRIEHVTQFKIITTPQYTTDSEGENENKFVHHSSVLQIFYQEDRFLYYDIPEERFSEVLDLVEVLTNCIKK